MIQAEPFVPSRGRARRIDIIPVVCGILAFILYEWTNAPGLFWGDAGEFIAASGTLGIGHAYGHPLFWLLGRIAILLDPLHPAAAMNHLVAIISGLVCGLIARFTRIIIGKAVSQTAAAFTMLTVAGLYAVSTTFWAQATFVEVYNLQALFLILSLMTFHRYAFVDGDARHLCASAFFWGLALTLGMYASLLILLPVMVMLLDKHRIRTPLPILALAGLCCLIGLSPWLYLIVRSGAEGLPYWERIHTLRDFFAYLGRSPYAGFEPAGPAALLVGMTETLRIIAVNFGVWGGVLFLATVWKLVKDRSSRIILPYVISFPVLVLAYALLIPLTLTFRQMVDMDVYFLPAFLVGIPIIALGALHLIEKLKPWLRPVVIIPILLVAAFRWDAANLSDKSLADEFLDYMTDHIPQGSRIFPVSDEVAYPLLYHALGLGHTDDIVFLADADAILGGGEAAREGSTLLVEIDDPFIDALVARGDYLLAGPFLAPPADSALAERMESGFANAFSPDNLNLDAMNRLDRMSLARVWARRAVVWFTVHQKKSMQRIQGEAAYNASLECFGHAAVLDDFSFEGAQHAANLALTLARGGRLDEASESVAKAFRLNPKAPEALRAQITIAMIEQDYTSALDPLETLAKLRPRDAGIKMDLAGVYLILNRVEEAGKSYAKALSLGADPRPEMEDYLKTDQE